MTTIRPVTVAKDLYNVDRSILSALKHLDLTGCISEMSAEARGQGAYSEVFWGSADIPRRGQTDVAIKRLRFHVASTNCKLVCDDILQTAQTVINIRSFSFSCSSGKYTSGQG